MRGLGADHHRLDGILGRVYAAGQRHIGLDVTVQDGRPAQAQLQFIAAAQREIRHDFQGFQIEIGLIKAVEDHHAVDARFIQLLDEVRDRTEEVSHLHRHRNLDTGFHIAHQVQVHLLYLCPVRRQAGGDVVHVEFQRIRARFFHQLGVTDPAAGADTV